MWRVFVILCVAAATFARDSKVHEQMTAEEVMKTFGTNHASVPDYEVIPVSHGFHKRSRIHRVVQLKTFNMSMTLYLEPTDGYLAGDQTPVYTATSDESGIKYELVPNAIKGKNTQFFQDPVQLASLLIQPAKDGKALIEGIIDKFAIRPLPERFRSQFKRDKRAAAAAPDEYLQSNQTVYHSNLEDTHHHVVFKIPSAAAEGQPKQKRGRMANRAPNAAPRGNNVPQTVHPQMLLIMESDLFDIFNKNIDDTISYILSFWNAADLRYRVFQNPNIRLNIAGIILAKDASVTKYIKKNHVKVTEKLNNKIQVQRALDDYAHFMYTDTTYDQKNNVLTFAPLNLDYDLTVTMTPFDMCEIKPNCMRGGRYRCSQADLKSGCQTLGLAYHTGACSYDTKDHVMEAVAIVEDTGAFAGIIPAAHEVGHLLGASHQETKRFDCARGDGYIMSFALIVTQKSFIWSECSVLSIQDFLKKESRAQCVFNQPNIGTKVERVLPGKIFSREEQCARLFTDTGTCNVRELDDEQTSTCDKLSCGCKISPTSVPVAEGTECGDGKHCINAKCVDVEETNVELEVGTAPPTTTTDQGKYVEVDYEMIPGLE